MKKSWSLFLIPVSLIILIALISLAGRFYPNKTGHPILANNAIASPSPSVEPTQTQEPEPSLNKTPVPAHVFGIYSTSWIAGSKHIDQIIQFIKQSKINTIVIDMKDDTGVVSFPTQVPLAKEIGATSNRISNIKELLARLKQEKIYTIARIVVFKDPLLAKKHPEIAVLDKNGGLWHDRKGMVWVDPNNKQVWKYNLDIAKEAVALGFSEIQFDYVRFLSDGKISNCVYPFSTGQPKEDVIRDFLLYAKKDINALGVPLSADIFGLVLSVPDDLNIGQKLEKIASAVDYISPMVYPSHYPKGSFGFANPDLYPYEVVTHALQDGLKRIQNSKAKLRPWLQDFSLGNPYGHQELAAQVKALEENGIHDWLFWNPKNKYEDQARYSFE